MLDWLEQLRLFLQQPGGKDALGSATAIVSPIVSLAVAIMAAIVAFKVARMQIRANTVAANRQKWVDEMRSVLAELLALNYVVTHAPQKHNDIEASIKVFTLRNKIRLLTDSGNEEHSAINASIERLISAPPSRSYDDTAEQDLIDASHRLFEAELSKVKAGR